MRRALALIIAAAVAGCAAMPETSGERARLIPGIAAPRDRAEIDITVHELPVTAWPKCLEMTWERSPALAVVSALTLSVIHACAHVPKDAALAPGERPWCVVAVPAGDARALEHELRHCEGWNHPS